MTHRTFKKIADALEEARLRVLYEVETQALVDDKREDSPFVRRLKVKHGS